LGLLLSGKDKETVYRKGIDEGFQQGYWKARKELETRFGGTGFSYGIARNQDARNGSQV